jgi:hypothetical protein
MSKPESQMTAPEGWACEWCGKSIAGEPTSWSCDRGETGYPVCSRRCRMAHERFVDFKKPSSRQMTGLGVMS